MNRVALLRGVNVTGNRIITMADLRAFFAKVGFADVQTLLQSGNVVFTGDRRSNATLEEFLEIEMEKRLKITTSYFVRNTKELKATLEANPFPKEAQANPGFVHVVFLKKTPTARDLKAIRAANAGPELIDVVGRQAYVYYPQGQGQSRFRLAWHGTARNWNTVNKLLAMMA